MDAFLAEYISLRKKSSPVEALDFLNAIEYSLFGGGKRFRPLVCFLVSDLVDCSFDRVLPFAAAVEMVHTYSLIHDDLPCMDDDDFRRGKPTNHKVYGEPTALLAGDALLTDAFDLLSEAYQETPDVGLKLVSLLSRAAGVGGMMSGQYLDIKAADSKIERQLQIHNLKTGKLISVCAAGVLEIAKATLETKNNIISIADKLGLAFQLQDDLLDFSEHEKESSSLPAIIGYEKTKSMLAKISSEACEELKGLKNLARSDSVTELLSSAEALSSAADSFCDLFNYNLERK